MRRERRAGIPEVPTSGHNPFMVPVSDLLDRTGARRRVVLSGSLFLELDQLKECGPVRAALEIQETGGSLLVRGEITALFRLRCNRCLAPVSSDISRRMIRLCAEESGEDVLEIGPDGSIDLSEAIRDEMCLSVPLVPLCSAACRGLCPSCGADLNADPCGGHRTERSSPFSALEGWLEGSRDRNDLPVDPVSS